MYKEKNCEGVCPKCGSNNIDYMDDDETDRCDDTEERACSYCSCNECGTCFYEYYTIVYCNTSWEEDEMPLNDKTLFDSN